jgi:hypothetical protein
MQNERISGESFHLLQRTYLFVLTLLYLFDQRINSLAGFNAAGSVAVVAISCLYSIFRYKSKYTVSLKSMIIALFLSAFVLLAYGNNDSCSVQLKGAFSLLLFLLIIATMCHNYFDHFIKSTYIPKILLAGIVIFSLLDYVGFNIFSSANNSGVYYEASHVALYSLPLLTYMLLKSHKDLYALLMMTLLLVLSPSTTIFIGLLLVFAVCYMTTSSQNIATSILFVFASIGILLFLIITDIISMPDTNARIISLFTSSEFETVNHLNLSSIVWLNGWSQAMQTINETNGLGVGFNQMGCGKFINSGQFTPLIQAAFSGEVLNVEDGSLMSAKLIAEFGYLGIVMVIALAWRCIRVLIEFVNKNYDCTREQRDYLILRATGSISLIVYLFVRSGSYFQLPVVLAIYLLFFTRSLGGRMI